MKRRVTVLCVCVCRERGPATKSNPRARGYGILPSGFKVVEFLIGS